MSNEIGHSKTTAPWYTSDAAENRWSGLGGYKVETLNVMASFVEFGHYQEKNADARVTIIQVIPFSIVFLISNDFIHDSLIPRTGLLS